MTQQTTTQPRQDKPANKEQHFRFSANRGQARHRLRYQEGSSTLLQSSDCFFCRS